MFDTDLGEALLRSAEVHANRPAIWALGERLTYAEMFDRAGAVAAALASRGVSRGSRVAVLGQRSAWTYSAIVGILLAGCTYVPLNTRFPPARNQKILDAADVSALVLDPDTGGRLDSYLNQSDPALPLIVGGGSSDSLPPGRTGTPAIGSGAAFWRACQRGADRMQSAYLLFTSGTTGEPKGVPLSHANVGAYLTGIDQVGAVTAQDRVLQLVDLTFDLSVHDMFATWLKGAELYVVPENASLLAPRLMRRHQITACLLVPSTAAGAIEQNQAPVDSLPSLRLSFFCGEALPRSVAAAWSAAAPNSRVTNIYGPTEATIAFSAYEYKPDEGAEFSVLPIGRPLGDQRMALFDADQLAVPPGQPGEICLAGSQLTEGYWRSPDLNGQKFFHSEGERWYRTGDLGRFEEPVGFVFMGRADRQVKIRGYRAELQEIEGVVRRVTRRQQVAVLPWPLRSAGVADGSVAFICGEELDVSDVRAECRALVADYLVPDRLVFIDDLPLNSNGKVDYNALSNHPALAVHA